MVICESQCDPGVLRMWLVGWDWRPRGSVVSTTGFFIFLTLLYERIALHETVTDNPVFSTMYHLSRNGARFQMFAPNQQQMNVMDHMKKQPATADNR